VNDDCLKLTTYFGERDRSARGLVADELLDIYGRHEVPGSILLRGVEGFGARHRLRTDRLLTLSEDLPMVSIAVDSRSRIEGLLDDVMEIKGRGLVTLERARLLSGAVGAPRLPEQLDEASKLTIYLGRQERVGRTPAFVAVCDLLYRRGVAGATALLGVDGTVHGRRARARFFARNIEVPMMVSSVGSGARIAGVMEEVSGLLRQPLLTLERVRLCKRDGQLIARPHALPGTDEHGLALWQKLTVHTSEAARYEGKSLHRELVRRLREMRLAGATSLRGVWGFHGDHSPHGDKLLQVHRHVPVVTIVIDAPERIAETFEVIDELTAERGLVTSEMVPASAALHDEASGGGLRLARHSF
jgi:PII-like signaling protein